VTIKGLDGQSYNWKLTSKPRTNASKPHRLCREILKEFYPLDQILEELFLPGAESNLYLDFYLPLRRLAVEVDGVQHGKYIKHFNNYDKMNYYKSIKRDKQKTEWCQINEITLIRVLAEEGIDEWRNKLRRD
jgi:hypothetical protein